MPPPERYRTRCAFSPDGKHVAWNEGGKVRLVDVAAGKVARTLEGEPGPLAFSPDGGRLALCCQNGTALVWDLKAKKKR